MSNCWCLVFSDSRCSLRYLRDPPEGTCGRESTSFEQFSVKITTGEDQLQNEIDMMSILKKSTRKRAFFTHAQRRNGRIDSNQNLHIDSWGRSNTAAKLAFKVSDVTTVIN